MLMKFLMLAVAALIAFHVEAQTYPRNPQPYHLRQNSPQVNSQAPRQEPSSGLHQMNSEVYEAGNEGYYIEGDQDPNRGHDYLDKDHPLQEAPLQEDDLK